MYSSGGYSGMGRGYGSSSYTGSSNYSSAPLEQIVMESREAPSTRAYEPTTTPSNDHYWQKASQQMEFNAGEFLNLDLPVRFIGDAQELQPLMEQAFMATTGQGFPADLIVHLCTDSEMAQAHRNWDPSIQGFAHNNNGRGTSEIFIRKDRLDKCLLTIGHEIGHCLTPSLGHPVDEEAKAFAFSFAWMQAIHEKNIAGLTNSINPRPAENGLHNVAMAFVAENMKQATAIDVFKELARGNLSITKTVETITI